MLLKSARLSRGVPVLFALMALLAGTLGAQAPATQAPAPKPATPAAKPATPAAKPAAPTTAASLPSAREVIDRHIKSIGGREALLSHKSAHVTGTFSVPASGMVGTIEMYGAANPDRTLVKITIPGLGEMLNGYDGAHGWAVTPMTGPMLQMGKELDQTKLDAEFYGELRDPKRYKSLKTLEKTIFPAAEKGQDGKSAEGRPCYKISLVRIDGNEDFEFYDVETGLRAGAINTRESPMGTVTTTVVETDYKKFGNVLQATNVVQKMMGVEQKLTLATIEYDSVPESVFELPAQIKALIK
jgi:hypothetical protein